MTRLMLCLSILVLAGCHTCDVKPFVRQPDTSDPWNTNYLIDADPEAVTSADLDTRAAALDEHYWTYSQVEGVLWPTWRSDASLTQPDRWINGGDSGIYTGMALAAFAFKYGATKSDEAIQNVRDSLRGVYILTHASGTPGVVQRNSFEASRALEFGFPQEWGGRDPRFVNTGPAFPDPFGGPQIPPHTYYTRGTKDQLTGMLLGLAATWVVFDPATVAPSHAVDAVALREVASEIINALYTHLKAHNWNIRDENGQNDTNADHVDMLLRAVMLALKVHTGSAELQEEYDTTFEKFVDLTNVLIVGDRFNNYQQYFAHNLRACRALSIWMLEGGASDKGQKMTSYIRTNLWKFVEGHKNAWFAFLRAAMAPSDIEARDEGIYSLKSLSLKPTRLWFSPYFGQEQKPSLVDVTLGCHTNFVIDPHLRKPEDYSTWQKEPWDTGGGADWDKEGRGDSSGLDFLLAYWMGKAYGIF